ncbi:hypothetical protein BKP45_15160 [Anaerobacillus alkalidiazotrophicus]|uniref:Uncharacterized protein n=1 Tax=Anaerobacillus alkalidiazotrophicus TaxID=472963 RepID=A0A1S2M4S0_9BACI|nr:hypothetical protein [Anaerobacillus alkalidiazotrophicus]OIJ18867.1 hypothetical protein BKP45_15160 [Anaerobacillus alkalidiazotrophicus]
MRDPENEIVYDGPLEAVDRFAKEFDGIDQTSQNGIQEVWKSGINEGNNAEVRAEDMKNRPNS